MKDYVELNVLELDTLKEIGSIGTGNAATALSELIGQEIRIQMPEVRIMEYNEAIEWIGGPEEITSCVLVRLSGQVNGIMLSVQNLEFVNLIMSSMLGKKIEDYNELGELETSALTEVGNIMISTFINALTDLADVEIDVTVPAFAVDMQGAILTVPMAEYGGQSNYIMTIGGNFVCNGRVEPCHLLMSPDLRSLEFLFRKLGVSGGN